MRSPRGILVHTAHVTRLLQRAYTPIVVESPPRCAWPAGDAQPPKRPLPYMRVKFAAALSPRGWLAAVVRGLAAPASHAHRLPAREQSAARNGVGFRAVGERPRDGGSPPSRSAWALPFPALRAEARLLEGGLVILLPIAVWTRADGVPSAAVGPCGARLHPAWRGRLSL